MHVLARSGNVPFRCVGCHATGRISAQRSELRHVRNPATLSSAHGRSSRRGRAVVSIVSNSSSNGASFWGDDPKLSPISSPVSAGAIEGTAKQASITDVERLLRLVAEGKVTPHDASVKVLEASSAATLGSWNTTGKDGEQLVEDCSAILGVMHNQTSAFPEVIWAPGQTPEEIAASMRRVSAKGKLCMATRITPEVYEVLRKQVPHTRYHPRARICTAGGTTRGLNEWGCNHEYLLPGSVVVLAAVTADLPIAEEAVVSLNVMGCKVQLLPDLGGGLHRILDQLHLMRSADVVLVAAGMDGALSSIVAGVVECPVVSIPTSVGSTGTDFFRGLAPLLSSLNACSPGVSVVNIDNGFGAAMVAARILRQAARMSLSINSAKKAQNVPAKAEVKAENAQNVPQQLQQQYQQHSHQQQQQQQQNVVQSVPKKTSVRREQARQRIVQQDRDPVFETAASRRGPGQAPQSMPVVIVSPSAGKVGSAPMPSAVSGAARYSVVAADGTAGYSGVTIQNEVSGNGVTAHSELRSKAGLVDAAGGERAESSAAAAAAHSLDIASVSNRLKKRSETLNTMTKEIQSRLRMLEGEFAAKEAERSRELEGTENYLPGAVELAASTQVERTASPNRQR